MADYYQILGLSRSADSTQIRTAYKRLAMQYHPDKNPGNKHAEEIFKTVNEAYHTLSDPLKKSRYDARMFSFNSTAEFTNEVWREAQKRRYRQWKQAQQSRYRFDRNYFKVQGLAFLMFIVLSGFSFGVIHTVYYFIDIVKAEEWRANSVLLKQVNGLFEKGAFDEAFTMISGLRKKDPLEYRYSFAKDSLVDELRKVADKERIEKDFASAVQHYEILRNHEEPVSLETLEMIATCEYYLGHYKETLQALKHLHNQQPTSLELLYSIGMINLEKTDNKEEALQYFTLGKKLFKENMSEVYGTAFEILLDPSDAPDIYYDIFIGRARTNLALKNFKDAISDCNWAIYLRPKNGEPYWLRVQSKAGAHEFSGICEDVNKAIKLGAVQKSIRNKYCR